MIEKFTMHALVSPDTTETELGDLRDFVKRNRMCGLETPYPLGKRSICLRQEHGADKKCGGELYRMLNEMGLDRPLDFPILE